MTSNTEFGNISFDLPKNQSNVIKVIGVGGGGSNAINHMFQQGINGVDFVICNTDSQALQNSSVPNKIQLGVSLTEGLGAGANPDVGEQAAIESLEDIKGMLDTSTKMAFITAGMGGGTGTGAAPVIAKLAKDMDILTVGIVTMPFQFEGKMRNEQAQKGIENLRKHVDSLIVINNNKLREVYGNLGFKAGFSKADEVLATASRGIAEVITHHYTQNIDLRDAKTVLSNSGTAIMGSATASGTHRAAEAIAQALDSPLLNDNKITGAQNVLLLIVSGTEEITLDEIGEINDHIQGEAGHSANIIMGVGEDEELGDAIAVTIIATGFNQDQQHEIVNVEAKKIIHTLEDEQRATQDLSPKSTGSNFSNVVAKSTSVTTKVTQERIEVEQAPVIKHSLEEEVVEEKVILEATPVAPEAPVVNQTPEVTEAPMARPEGYVKTTEVIKNIDVDAEEVTITPIAAPIQEEVVLEDDFEIIDTTEHINQIEVNNFEEVEETSKEQFSLSFDMPLFKEEVEEEAPQAAVKHEDEEEKVVMFELTDTTKEIEVNDALEITPPEVNDGEVKRYSLEDYMEMESALENARPQEQPKKKPEVDRSVVFEKKVVVEEVEEVAPATENTDPFNNPIKDLLQSRADERRRKLKDFNYKFNSNIKKIDEIEKEPAYKRMGVDLNAQPTISNSSRLSLNRDSNDELQLRSNNSFLHDNVD
ncbi:cell division protein FtsZ [Neptunitalea lumnitzerae]|uniref:Cell division protein FtsZ n=1 Tax=Neptunitalea lumnitzerae TaxID=2965509 RepID=A0ABQ5MI70_9FLAO|nr:cell division protein FtsZ [Neptunitalea sp. Y10]GLB49103.1 cell division protein FtsZ [Neptunitalea sp. Y10]